MAYLVKYFNPGERKKIRTILNDIVIPKEMGLIVRTAGSNKTKNDIDHDLQTLIKTWNEIKDKRIKFYSSFINSSRK